MGDRPRAGTPARFVTSRSGNSAFYRQRVAENEYRAKCGDALRLGRQVWFIQWLRERGETPFLGP